MYKKKALKLIESSRQEDEIIETHIKNKASDNGPIQILEAGCGNHWPYSLGGIQYILTGVDMDKKALEIRKNTLSDLDEAIEGDLCSVDLGADRFDVVYCSFVLEHIQDADKVLDNFIKWTKENGIIIIKIPDPYSVAGFITRITPHWFHVFYHRYFLEIENAGKPGYAPYPTFYHPIVSRKGIHSLCDNRNGTVILDAEYGDGYVRQGQGAKKMLIHIIKKTVSILSIGFLSCKHSRLIYVIRKKSDYQNE